MVILLTSQIWGGILVLFYSCNMKRRKFIDITSKAITLGALLPNNLFAGNSIKLENYTFEQLIGKDESVMVGSGYQLRKEAAEAFEKMKAAAATESIELHSQSSFRSFAHQKRIWDGKYARFTAQGMSELETIRKIIEYSTIPGTSRHHWGTDLDIIDKAKPIPADSLSATHFRKGGLYEKMHFWLTENAESFGFQLVYTDVEGRKGFKYEPWHFSYTPLSIPMLKCYMELDFEGLLKSFEINGSKYFTSEFIAQYRRENVLDINPDLIPR